MKSGGLAVFGIVAACAACCAPLAVPLLWGAVAGVSAGGMLFGLPSEAVVGGALALVLLAVVVVWRQRRRRAPAALGMCAPSCSVETCTPVRSVGNQNQPQAVQQ